MKVEYDEGTDSIVTSEVPEDGGDIVRMAPNRDVSFDRWQSGGYAFIVRAVNCHEQLVEALEEALRMADFSKVPCAEGNARAALAAAKGEDADVIFADATNNDVVVTLPKTGTQVTVIKADNSAHTVTIVPPGGEE